MKTPRTDAHTAEGYTDSFGPDKYVPTSFARKLERELKEANKKIEEQRQSIDVMLRSGGRSL